MSKKLGFAASRQIFWFVDIKITRSSSWVQTTWNRRGTIGLEDKPDESRVHVQPSLISSLHPYNNPQKPAVYEHILKPLDRRMISSYTCLGRYGIKAAAYVRSA